MALSVMFSSLESLKINYLSNYYIIVFNQGIKLDFKAGIRYWTIYFEIAIDTFTGQDTATKS